MSQFDRHSFNDQSRNSIAGLLLRGYRQSTIPTSWSRCMNHSGYGLSQWETTSWCKWCNAVCHWLSPYPEWSLTMFRTSNKYASVCVCFSVVVIQLFLGISYNSFPTFSGVTSSLTLAQSYNFTINREMTVWNIGKVEQNQTTSKHNLWMQMSCFGQQSLWRGRYGCNNGRYGCAIVMSYTKINKAVSQWLLTFNPCVSVTWHLWAFHIPSMHIPEIIWYAQGRVW